MKCKLRLETTALPFSPQSYSRRLKLAGFDDRRTEAWRSHTLTLQRIKPIGMLVLLCQAYEKDGLSASGSCGNKQPYVSPGGCQLKVGPSQRDSQDSTETLGRHRAFHDELRKLTGLPTPTASRLLSTTPRQREHPQQLLLLHDTGTTQANTEVLFPHSPALLPSHDAAHLRSPGHGRHDVPRLVQAVAHAHRHLRRGTHRGRPRLPPLEPAIRAPLRLLPRRHPCDACMLIVLAPPRARCKLGRGANAGGPVACVGQGISQGVHDGGIQRHAWRRGCADAYPR